MIVAVLSLPAQHFLFISEPGLRRGGTKIRLNSYFSTFSSSPRLEVKRQCFKSRDVSGWTIQM